MAGDGWREEGRGPDNCVADAGEHGVDLKVLCLFFFFSDAGEYGVDLKFLCRKHAGESLCVYKENTF